ncbi:hypothetical protein C8R43DRAFT_890625 [Mycena crocata]|nr:hypothetical protein C8R43DRAFT_890625 [Mycena crocata]
MLPRTLLNHLWKQPRILRNLSWSSVEGPLEPPLVTTTLSQYFRSEILEKHGSRPALVCRKESPRAHGGPFSQNLGIDSHLAWSFEEFNRHIDSLARGLLTMGVQRGDRVGVLMGNNSAYAMLQWACASIGAVLVTINPAYRINELANVLNLVGVGHLFVVPQIRSSSYVEMLSEKFPDLRNSQPGAIQEPLLPALRNLVVVDNTGQFKNDADKLGLKSWIDWRETMVWDESSPQKAVQEKIVKSLHKDDVINIQFTSGTTGAPKAVSLTHFNLLNNGLSIGRCMRLSEIDVLCNVPPLFHCFDDSRLVLGNLAAWSHGACIVYASEIFDPKAIVDAVVQEKCTALHGVPTHFLGVLAEVDRRRASGETLDMRRLRTGIAAGSPIPIELMKKLIDRLNLVELTNAFGMTETSPVSFQTIPADPIIKRVETVGKVQPHVRAKVVDDEGQVVPVGTPGEVWIAGYLLQKGYWKDEEQTRQVIRPDEDGTLWMRTGDEGILDDEGYLRSELDFPFNIDHLMERFQDIIIRGGENLFPIQIENVILTHPEIEEAAVVAVPDSKFGEVVGAWIVRRPGSTITREAVRATVAQSMNPQNSPTWVFFTGDDGCAPELPKTASGKVMKHVLRDWSRDLADRKVGLVVK